MPDQKLAAPYGDIVYVNTPNLDKMGALIYNEEKQRKAAQAKADAALDDEFAKNIAGIKNADIPELTKNYADWKALRQATIGSKGGVSPEMQMKVLQAKAKIYDGISKSKMQKETDKLDIADVNKNSIRYKKDVHEKILKNMNTPTSQLPQNYRDDYLYDGSQTDFSKALDFAKGKAVDMPTEEVPNANGLGKSLYSVKRLSNPTEYFHNILTKVVGDQQTDDFSKKYHVEPDEYNKVKDQYDLLMSDPKVKSRFGMQVDLPQESDLTPLTRAAKYLAMQHAIVNQPVVSLNKEIKDDKAIIDYKHAQKVADMYLQDALIKRRATSGVNAESELNDVYGGISSQVDNDYFNGNTMTRVNSLSLDGQDFIVGLAKKLTGNPYTSNSNIFLAKDNNGIAIYKTDGNGGTYKTPKNLIGYLPPIGTNIKVQANAKGKSAAVQKGNQIINSKKTGSWRDKYVKH